MSVASRSSDSMQLKTVLFAGLVLSVGLMAGLVVSGRMSLTQPGWGAQAPAPMTPASTPSLPATAGLPDLPTLPWGDSGKLRVAEWVLAIGNPFQLSGTVTLGIVSTVSRSANQVGAFKDLIQTDAAINPGNSGGALVDARGELVGINSMIYSETGGWACPGLPPPPHRPARRPPAPHPTDHA